MVPFTVPGGNPVTEEPGLSPRSPFTTDGPVLVTAVAPRTANALAVPSPTASWAAAVSEGAHLTPAQTRQLATDTACDLAASLIGLPAGLTQREAEVLRLVSRGLSNPEIATDLRVSRRTIDAHLRSIFAKLDVTTRMAAAWEANRMNLT